MKFVTYHIRLLGELYRKPKYDIGCIHTGLHDGMLMKNIFNLLIVLLPFLSIYRCPVPKMEMATFLVLIVALGFLFSRKRPQVNQFPYPLLLLLGLVAFCSLISIGLQPELQNPRSLILFRISKFIIIPLIVFKLGCSLFDLKCALRYLRIVTLVFVSYLMLQVVVFHATGWLLPNVAKSLVLHSVPASALVNTGKMVMYRPASLFLEPAHFSLYTVAYLIYCLFGYEKKHSARIYSAIFVSVGIFLSTSIMGIGLVIMAWGLFFALKLIGTGKLRDKIYILVVLVIIGGVFYLLRSTSFVEFIKMRLFSNLPHANAFKERTISYMCFGELPALYKTIGVGFGNPIPNVFFNSVAYFLYCDGIIGTLLLFAFFGWEILKTRYFQRMLCLFLLASAFLCDRHVCDL